MFKTYSNIIVSVIITTTIFGSLTNLVQKCLLKEKADEVIDPDLDSKKRTRLVSAFEKHHGLPSKTNQSPKSPISRSFPRNHSAISPVFTAAEVLTRKP